MFQWIRRWWPLCWKSTLTNEVQRREQAEIAFRREVLRLENDLDKANRRNTMWQLKVTRMMESRIGADSLLRRIQVIEDERMAVTLIHTPQIELVGYREEVKLVRFIVDIGLSQAMPPEVLAVTIREQIVDAALKQWQDQSILEHKE